MLKLKDYQENHINEIKQKIEEFLKIDANKICTFEAPTGSGKTIMMADGIGFKYTHSATSSKSSVSTSSVNENTYVLIFLSNFNTSFLKGSIPS